MNAKPRSASAYSVHIQRLKQYTMILIITQITKTRKWETIINNEELTFAIAL